MDLAHLGQSLQDILPSQDDTEKHVKVVNFDIDPSKGKYVCGECALTCKRAFGLRQHFLNIHINDGNNSFTCEHESCKQQFASDQALKRHARTSHRWRCSYPGCQFTPPTGALLARHEEQHSQRDNSFQARTCPHSGCRQIFLDQATLFAHYDGLHPLYTFSPSKTPFQCPCCPKKYSVERYMAIHQRRNHSTNKGFGDDEVSQDCLIQQSFESFAIKTSQILIDSDLEEEPDYHVFSASLARRGAMKPANAESDDHYPETFALDDHEQLQSNHNGVVKTADDFRHDAFGKRIVRWILVLLNLGDWLGVSETLDVWDTFLSPEQRNVVLQELYSMDVGNEDRAVLSALHGSVLCEVTHAWAQFKLILTFQVPEKMKQDVNSAKGTISAILEYCQAFEMLINEARPVASARGLKLPDLLRTTPADAATINPDATLIELLPALESRVKCRAVNPAWLQFTNALILKEMACYIRDLKIEVKAAYPLRLRTNEWYQSMGVF